MKTRQTTIGGKSLSLDNDFDTQIHYGKNTFSKHVEQNASEIDFNGFREILTRLSAIIEAHKNTFPQV
jgi:RNA-directed DNA polymerase